MADENSPELTDEQLAGLYGGPLTPRCDWKEHRHGACGGSPDAGGEFVVLATPHECMAGLIPAVLLTCFARAMWLRARRDAHTHCPRCGGAVLFGDMFALHGSTKTFDASTVAR